MEYNVIYHGLCIATYIVQDYEALSICRYVMILIWIDMQMHIHTIKCYEPTTMVNPHTHTHTQTDRHTHTHTHTHTHASNIFHLQMSKLCVRTKDVSINNNETILHTVFQFAPGIYLIAIFVSSPSFTNLRHSTSMILVKNYSITKFFLFDWIWKKESNTSGKYIILNALN